MVLALPSRWLLECEVAAGAQLRRRSGNRDSQFGAHGRFCDADDRGIVVFDEVERMDS